MLQQRLYGDLAFLWPIVSPPEDYAQEARYLRQALRSRLGTGRHTLLELGVGGGHLLSHLAGEFQATAVDRSPEMLALSMKLNPGVEHHLGDMRTLRLDRTFDAVLVHDAICYMLSEADLEAAFATARAHLRPGGVLLLAPDWFQEAFHGTAVHHWINSQDDLEVTFIEYVHDPDPDDTIIESVFFFLINQGGQLRIEQDRHVTGLFPRGTWLNLLDQAGFDVSQAPYPAYDGFGGNLLVGTLRQS